MRREKGFTLIELMVVVAVLGILAAIALPSYTQHMVKARRVAGATCLMEMAQFMERHYTTNMSYTDAVLPNTACIQEVSDHYVIRAPAIAATSYTLTATPTGTQASKDTLCETLSINQAGVRSVTGSAGSNVSKCF
ncbi:pilus assembly protein PilE [Stenotrophomonas pictorum JCM 9942]|uniref:Pilus assembly protein PilE n=1 Tax=Stenotrophomonas pictorum JCM 9942 TaxID=1236960 RepID=A0A0R0A8A1_9GAMM|nr:type IV pilin protein [Stenotrophomonas pictorum]KRG41270.1 pilus assembly protein PilE [Stenotrophomonas pictorum JCM 9942]